jgi:hypothetical protein
VLSVTKKLETATSAAGFRTSKFPETDVPASATAKIPAINASTRRAVLQQRDVQRLAINIRCQLHWTEYRSEWRFNPRAGQFIVQKIRALVDTDVKPTPRDRYDVNAVRLNFKCPGCGEVLRPATECRFSQEIICQTISSRSRDTCPGFCARLGFRQKHGSDCP